MSTEVVEDPKQDKPKQQVGKIMAETALALSCGGVFGYALDKAKTNVPWVISEQMSMGNFTMMRMFLSASATSTAAVLGLHTLGLKKRNPKPGLALGRPRFLGSCGANLVGGALLGMGMTLSGSCPGTIWAQIGSGTPHTLSVVLGGMSGTVLFGYLEKQFRKLSPGFHKPQAEREAADLVPAAVGYEAGAVLLIAMMSGCVLGVQQLFPWKEQQNDIVVLSGALTSNPFDVTAASLDPATAGAMIGLLQIPVQLSSGCELGQSSGWVMASAYLASLFDRNLRETAPYLYKAKSDAKAAFQIRTALGIAGGAALSQLLGGRPTLTGPAAKGCGGPLRGFVGGALLLFGSRLGGGCTSGHGLSGMATLSAGSVVSVFGMFGGGMAVGFIGKLLPKHRAPPTAGQLSTVWR
eukprot:CAMPEP_0117662566 /NCGR_PEP_ID=MMETSP0804-20121206/8119_1 /TAXON_ID=1074897 /ORGANISM="Tetraselmis astigmatica, Strain CCMP880" /LENGTH=408 /DNA_ID=CAMNT_0005469469 /DNA_START=194 /DNA_END=1420 /DNA_ORIENTATION=-